MKALFALIFGFGFVFLSPSQGSVINGEFLVLALLFGCVGALAGSIIDGWINDDSVKKASEHALIEYELIQHRSPLFFGNKLVRQSVKMDYKEWAKTCRGIINSGMYDEVFDCDFVRPGLAFIARCVNTGKLMETYFYEMKSEAV